MPSQRPNVESERRGDRFYVQKDKHIIFQKLSQGDDAPFKTMKDTWVLAASLGYRLGQRVPMRGGTQHVGFWHYLSLQEDIPLLQAIAIAETGDVSVLGDQSHVIRIAEEYANGGVDLITDLNRPDKEASLRAIGALILEQRKAPVASRPSSKKPPNGPRDLRRTPTSELIAAGENNSVEFKASARWNIVRGAKDSKIENKIVLAVTGFMNASGGTLIIGVNDEQVPVGLESDYKTFSKRPNKDGFENWLTDLLENTIGKPAIANLSVRFENIDGCDVCRIDVDAAPTPVYVNDDPWFYVRLNNSTRKLNSREVTEYVSNHWPRG